MVPTERVADIVVQRQSAIGEHSAAVAILPQGLRVMGHQDDVGTRHALAERFGALPAETLVSDFGDLVDQINVEIDRKTGGEGKPAAHPGRISVDRHVKIFGEFGERRDVIDHAAQPRPIDARQKCRVLAAAERPVKSAAETKRKRHPRVAAHHAAIWPLGAGKQPDQRRFAGPVDAEDAEIMP